MSFHYIFLEKAQVDYETLLKWYVIRSQQAAENFVTAVEDALQLICKDPTRYRKTYKQFHEINLKNYPFSIVYAIEEQQKAIVVTSIYHHKRNPRRKYSRK
jgi:plasmid stabilization system protein ParE